MSWFPGAIADPGLNAGYRRGVATMQVAVMHFTVGTDSRALIRNKGLAQFLFPKVGPPFQFAEANAVCSHACEWNRLGPGLEFERLSWDEPLTPDQIRWGGAVALWLSVTYGIPLVHYGGPRLPVGDGFRGFVNHGSLVHQACDQHFDGITDADFQAMVGAPSSAPAPKRGHLDMIVTAKSGAYKGRHWLLVGKAATEIDSKQVLQSVSAGTPRTELDSAQVKDILTQYGVKA